MKKYDLIVVGGGFAGTASAISSARQGLKVLLVEKGNCLGGASSNCLVNPFMYYYTQINGKRENLSAGLFTEIIDNLHKFKYDKAIEGNTFSEEYLKFILEKMALESGVSLLYRTELVGVNMDGKRVKTLSFSSKSGIFELEADYYIDATGDANLCYLAGFQFRLGRESDHLCQPMTLCFRLGGVDYEQFLEDRKHINEKYKALQAEGKIKNPRENVLIFTTLNKSVIHFNTTRVIKLNPTDPFDLTKAEIEAREQVYEMYDFLKTNFKAFEKSYVLMTAPEIGVRESRMIEGEYTLTGEEIIGCKIFDDAITRGNYEIDIHNPNGSGTVNHYLKEGEFYTIPYRTLIPKNSENLLCAGRCISADHEAQASIRIMPIVCCIGEGAGLAISVAKKSGRKVKDIDFAELHKLLVEANAIPEKF